MACRNRRALTEKGREIKKRLIDMDISQAEFCRRYAIPPNRFSDIMRGETKYTRIEKRIYNIFGMKGGEENGMGAACGGGGA